MEANFFNVPNTIDVRYENKNEDASRIQVTGVVFLRNLYPVNKLK